LQFEKAPTPVLKAGSSGIIFYLKNLTVFLSFLKLERKRDFANVSDRSSCTA